MDDFVDICRVRTTEALDRFLLDLSFVPEDKLTWSPTPTAKSALQIAAHCAGYSSAFAAILRAGAFPWTRDEFRGPILSRIESVKSLDGAVTMLRNGITETLAALDTVQPELVGAMIDAPQGKTPFRFFLTLPAMHLETHGAQLDYLQTCWGDLDVHL